jgi:farnesyl diphosphate synthase
MRPEPAVDRARSAPDPDLGFGQWSRRMAARAEAALERVLPPADATPRRLHEAMRYAVLGGGKRVRPLLVYAAGEACAAPVAALDCAAAAVELIHAYSLVHDDMPCMDDDALRRGKPTVHVAYGEATAMLVGDALQALAFEVLAGAPECGAPVAAGTAMCAELARAAGSSGMAGGQSIDLEAVGRRLELPELEDMHRRKTGAMLRVSVRLGALCGAPMPAGRLEALTRYGEAIGLAFQVVDDILDVEGDSATLGKTAGKDSASDKPTYVSLLGIAGSRRMAAALHEQACAALAPLGGTAVRLRELADLVVLRSA